ncbi:MAG TPA: serine/threonine-protein kinase, partial [Candidatus Hydrogenedentes bacterium]|nr:serine/threonine-protein kinase [Candidatus Hydrogenedentota bacterium]
MVVGMDVSESANPGGFPTGLDRPDGEVPVSDGAAAPTLPDAGSLLDMDGAERAIQETAGRYVGVREIARGGMGRILLAFDSTLDREVIIKELLPPSEAADVTRGAESRPFSGAHPLLRRFLQEARITGSLEHPSIVPVYELGRREDDTPYYTMKVVHGKTLSKAIQAASSLRERLLLLPHFVNLCQAIAYAHSRGVIHRDLKPDNVMIGEYGETVVLDWGLARKLGGADVYEAVDGEG